MGRKFDAADKRIIYIIYRYGGSISRRTLQEVVYKLKEAGVKFRNIEFYEPGFCSAELNSRIRKLAEEGYIKEFYLAGPGYLNLYDSYYKITKKGIKMVEKLDIDKRDVRKIDAMLESMRRERGVKARISVE